MEPWIELVEEKHLQKTFTRAIVRFGSDILKVTDAYEEAETAKTVAESFIEGIDIMRGGKK
jgi:hypothetical protein